MKTERLHQLDCVLQNNITSHGELRNYNTVEGFKTADRSALLKQIASQIWEAIRSGAAERDPALLTRFLMTSHAGLKNYKYFYWCAVLCCSAMTLGGPPPPT